MLDDLIWVIVLFQIMLGNFLRITNILSLILFGLIVISFSNIKFFIETKHIILFVSYICCVLIYPFCNYYKKGGDVKVLLNNIFYILTSLSILMYIVKLCIMRPSYIKEKMIRFYPLINFYAVVNIIVMIAQLIVNKKIYNNVTEYKDSISGLFGIYGTPICALYISFVVIYDYFLFKYYKKNTMLFLFIVLFANLLLGLFNDNKGFYLVLIMFVGFTWFVINYGKITKKHPFQGRCKFFIKVLFVSSIMLVIFYYLKNYTNIGNFYDRIVHELTMGWNKTNLVQGSNERFGMISFALSSPQIRYFGTGLASIIWKKENAFGFAHFGQSDIGVFLILGGIAFCLILTVYLLVAFEILFNRFFMAAMAVIIMLVLGVYTQIFTNLSIMLCIALYIITCWIVLEIVNDNSTAKD